ncbi:MAG: hypothetical protein GY844_11135 [Bradyrhizobium sp.]|nr:hypothetical protein [Bradyrhizobium sp.]
MARKLAAISLILLAAAASGDAAAQTIRKVRPRTTGQNSELKMIQLQSTVSQRQQALQTSKNVLDSTRCKNCAQNIR